MAGPLFDARQVLLSESTAVPDANWQTSSLFQRLRSALLYPPRTPRGEHFLVREIDATNALALLGQRGIDSEWIVRFGLAKELPTRLALWVLDSYSKLGQTGQPPQWIAPWFEAFEKVAGECDTTDIGQLLAAAHRSGFIEGIRRWLQQAPLSDVVAWSLIDSIVDETNLDDGQARWMLDRFTETYLRDWSETSLHHEYQYLRGRMDPPIAVPEMRRRQLAKGDIDRELARRAVEGSRSRLVEVKSQALGLLGEGRRREAAALFDAARILEPQDSEAHNNYGFCLTPEDPETALRALIRAEELGITTKALNLLNQAIALRLLDRLPEALAVAERSFADTRGRCEPAWLWVNLTGPDEPSIENFDLATYICHLGSDLAEELDDEQQRQLWQSRLAESKRPTD